MKLRIIWAVVILLVLATMTTIDAPPVVFNPPPMVRMVMGSIALALLFAAAWAGRKKA